MNLDRTANLENATDSHRTAIVVGGGLVGGWSAFYLQQAGWQVRVLERDTFGSGASHGNCGYICPSHVLPLSGPGVITKTLPALLTRGGALSIPPRLDPTLWKWLYRFARECTEAKQNIAAVGRHALLVSSGDLYRQFLAATNCDCEWQEEGLMLVYKSSREFQAYTATADLLRERFGLRIDAYPTEALSELEPALKKGLGGGWHFPDDAHVRPDKLLKGLRQQIESAGGHIHEHCTVQSLRIENGKLLAIQTNEGSFDSDVMVLATGAEAPQFAKRLGCQIPIQPGKGYSFTMPAFAEQPKIPMIFEESHVAVTPMQSGFRVGSTMQFTGYDRSLNRERLQLLRRSAESHLEKPLPTEVSEEWSGWRPMVYDGLPCIDRAPAASNVIVAAGNGMIGLASSPATGKLVAEIASEMTPHIDPYPYSLSRFNG